MLRKNQKFPPHNKLKFENQVQISILKSSNFCSNLYIQSISKNCYLVLEGVFVFTSELLRNTCFRIMISQMYLGFKFHCFGRSTKGVSNLLSNLFFDLSTRLFFENAFFCDFGLFWTILLTLSDVFFRKYVLKRPVYGQLNNIFYS